MNYVNNEDVHAKLQYCALPEAFLNINPFLIKLILAISNVAAVKGLGA